MKFLRELNGSAVKHGIRALTTAAVIGFYATDSNPYFAYAGHAPALLRRKDSFEWQPLELDAESTHHPNAPLGVIPNTGFDQKQVALAPGDRVFLHTDGLTEVTNIARVPFGAERLKQTLTDAGGKPLPELKRSVLDAVARHVGESSEQDDVTLLHSKFSDLNNGPADNGTEGLMFDHLMKVFDFCSRQLLREEGFVDSSAQSHLAYGNR